MAAPLGGMGAPHRPVLLRETIQFLEPERGGLFVDCTVGLGGHTEAILESADATRVIGIDRDREALEVGERAVKPISVHAFIQFTRTIGRLAVFWKTLANRCRMASWPISAFLPYSLTRQPGGLAFGLTHHLTCGWIPTAGRRRQQIFCCSCRKTR